MTTAKSYCGEQFITNKYHNQSSLTDKKFLYTPFYEKGSAGDFTRGMCLGYGFFSEFGTVGGGMGSFPFFNFHFVFPLIYIFSFSQEMEPAQSRLSEFKLNCCINLLKHSSASFHITVMTVNHQSKELTYSSCSRSPCLNMLGMDGCFSLTFLQLEPAWSSLVELKSWHHLSDPPCFLLTGC